MLLQKQLSCDLMKIYNDRTLLKNMLGIGSDGGCAKKHVNMQQSSERVARSYGLAINMSAMLVGAFGSITLAASFLVDGSEKEGPRAQGEHVSLLE